MKQPQGLCRQLVTHSIVNPKYFMQLADHQLVDLLRQAFRDIVVFGTPLHQLPIAELQSQAYHIYQNTSIKEKEVQTLIEEEFRKAARFHKKMLENIYAQVEKDKDSLNDMRPQDSLWVESFLRSRVMEDESSCKAYGVVGETFWYTFQNLKEALEEVMTLVEYLMGQSIIPMFPLDQFESGIIGVIIYELTFNTISSTGPDMTSILPTMSPKVKQEFVNIHPIGIQQRMILCGYDADIDIQDCDFSTNLISMVQQKRKNRQKQKDELSEFVDDLDQLFKRQKNKNIQKKFNMNSFDESKAMTGLNNIFYNELNNFGKLQDEQDSIELENGKDALIMQFLRDSNHRNILQKQKEIQQLETKEQKKQKEQKDNKSKGGSLHNMLSEVLAEKEEQKKSGIKLGFLQSATLEANDPKSSEKVQTASEKVSAATGSKATKKNNEKEKIEPSNNVDINTKSKIDEPAITKDKQLIKNASEKSDSQQSYKQTLKITEQFSQKFPLDASKIRQKLLKKTGKEVTAKDLEELELNKQILQEKMGIPHKFKLKKEDIMRLTKQELKKIQKVARFGQFSCKQEIATYSKEFKFVSEGGSHKVQIRNTIISSDNDRKSKEMMQKLAKMSFMDDSDDEDEEERFQSVPNKKKDSQNVKKDLSECKEEGQTKKKKNRKNKKKKQKKNNEAQKPQEETEEKIQENKNVEQQQKQEIAYKEETTEVPVKEEIEEMSDSEKALTSFLDELTLESSDRLECHPSQNFLNHCRDKISKWKTVVNS